MTVARSALPPAPALARRWGRPLAVGVTVLLLAIAAWALWRWWTFSLPDYRALDIGHYLDATRRWLDSGTPYLAHEVQGPYPAYSPLTFLHPPVALYLFAPFLVLPVVLFWVVPLGVVGALVASWRPHWLTWPLLALALCTDGFRNAVVTGNTDMWMAAAVAAGLAYAWPAAIAVIKPTFIPIALLALRRRRGWLALAFLAVISVPLGQLWLDWIAVVRNGPGGPGYSLPNYLWVAAPGLAWLARSDRARHPTTRVGRSSGDPAGVA